LPVVRRQELRSGRQCRARSLEPLVEALQDLWAAWAAGQLRPAAHRALLAAPTAALPGAARPKVALAREMVLGAARPQGMLALQEWSREPQAQQGERASGREQQVSRQPASPEQEQS
jgi:hypothetical protein